MVRLSADCRARASARPRAASRLPHLWTRRVAYLAHPVLGARLRECAAAGRGDAAGRSANQIFGGIDALASCIFYAVPSRRPGRAGFRRGARRSTSTVNPIQRPTNGCRFSAVALDPCACCSGRPTSWASNRTRPGACATAVRPGCCLRAPVALSSFVSAASGDAESTRVEPELGLSVADAHGIPVPRCSPRLRPRPAAAAGRSGRRLERHTARPPVATGCSCSVVWLPGSHRDPPPGTRAPACLVAIVRSPASTSRHSRAQQPTQPLLAKAELGLVVFVRPPI